MARRKKQTPNMNVPPRRKKATPAGIGVAQEAEAAVPLRVSPKYAAHHSPLFPKGGEAFERWCADKGVSHRDQRSAEEWGELLDEFANRPIHGLRRGEGGGTHQANPSDLRR